MVAPAAATSRLSRSPPNVYPAFISASAPSRPGAGCCKAKRTQTNLDHAITAAHDNKWRWKRTTAALCLPGCAFMLARKTN